MKPENQVCALDQAKKLKELGISQNALFVWMFNANWRADKQPTHYLLPERSSGFCKQVWQGRERSAIATMLRETDAAAFTSAELGEMLPAFIAEDFDLACYKESMLKTWALEYSYPVIGGGIRRFMDVKIESGSEAKAKADMLIWLLEQGHATAEEVNARLLAA